MECWPIWQHRMAAATRCSGASMPRRASCPADNQSIWPCNANRKRPQNAPSGSSMVVVASSAHGACPLAAGLSRQQRRAYADACNLAESDRTLLLDCPTQGAYPAGLANRVASWQEYLPIPGALPSHHQAVSLEVHSSERARSFAGPR